MTIKRKDFDIIKAAILTGPDIPPAALKAINDTEQAAIDHNKKMCAYILEKRKENKNFCR